MQSNQKPMRIFWLSALLLASIGCKRTVIDQTPATRLMKHTWYRYQTHSISVDTTHHLTLSDTSYFAAPCEQAEYFNFLGDDMATCLATCAMARQDTVKGTWHLSADSIISVLCPRNNAPGIPESYLGFNPSRLLEIDDTHFSCYEWRYWYSFSGAGGTIVYYDTRYSTYRAVVK